MTLNEASKGIGRKVIYTPFDGCLFGDLEYGVITSVNSKNVFVRYGTDVNSKSTDPNDLKFEGE